MRIPRIFEDQTLATDLELELSASAAQHLGRVLRMQPGQRIRLFNGQGTEFEAVLTTVTKREARARLTEVITRESESPLTVHLGQSLSRGERMDYAVQKATELGVTTISPLFSERCEVKLKGDRQDKRLQHWQQVAISACEQSERVIVPRLEEPCLLEQWVQSVDAELKLVLHHRTPKKLVEFTPPRSVALLIGPEGGLSEAEISAAEAAGFQSVALGPRVLRTETAPVAALSLVQYLWGDLS